jgi:organic hydroperoxide reductase OsmC/OhrA
MAGRGHKYRVTVQWTGNQGRGTSGYREYSRDHLIHSSGKPDIAGSSDPAFLGDPARWNPEELLVASASACHKLWYLHLCAEAGIVVQAYVDEAEGTMLDNPEEGRLTASLRGGLFHIASFALIRRFKLMPCSAASIANARCICGGMRTRNSPREWPPATTAMEIPHTAPHALRLQGTR